MATLIDNANQKALTTLQRAKSFLNISGDSKDTVLTMTINHATAFIESFLKRNLLSQAYTDEEYDGSGSETLILKQFPITAFTRLQVNTSGDSSASWLTIESTRYFWYADGRLVLNTSIPGFMDERAQAFIPSPKKYRVTYTGGYLIDFDQENVPASHTLPMDIEYACLKLVSAIMNTKKSEGIKSAKVGDITMTFRDEVMKDSELKEILGKYVAVTI